MDIKLEHIRQAVGRLADFTEKDIIKDINIEIKHADPGEGVPVDILTLTVFLKKEIYNNVSHAQVTRVIEVFPSSDNQKVKVTETTHWDIEERPK